MKEPKVEVDILFGPQIEFILLTLYHIPGKEVCDKQVVIYNEGRILWNGRQYNKLLFEPLEETAAFELLDVTIGINFHWERKEDQRFSGSLRIIVENGKLAGINIIHIKDYLTGVTFSEMSATAPLELPKAHAIISRSWLLAWIQKNKEIAEAHTGYSAFAQTDEESIRWYDREDHTHFDVYADDHCQHYRGITRASTDIVRQVIAATRGQVFASEGNICDARLSKCCSDIFEEFQCYWGDTRRPYLAKQHDYLTGSGRPVSKLPGLTQRAETDHRIRTSPELFCGTMDKKILSQVPNNYDQEATDFYHWKIEYTQDELSALILKRFGVSYGRIIDLVPVARGTSGHLWKLETVGTKKTRTIGKELEIRRTLSPSRLYSSAFVMDRAELSTEGMSGRFILTGAGWGHSVGLCQISAAVIGEQRYRYDTILLHYYTGATIDKLYD